MASHIDIETGLPTRNMLPGWTSNEGNEWYWLIRALVTSHLTLGWISYSKHARTPIAIYACGRNHFDQVGGETEVVYFQFSGLRLTTELIEK